MNALDLFLVGLSQLQANALRSLLTILGITIGVGAVIGVVSIGEGLRRNIVSQFSQVGGANLVIVQPPRTYEIKDGRRVPRSWREYLTARDLAALEGEVNHIQAAYPLVGWNTQVRYQKASATGEGAGYVAGVSPGDGLGTGSGAVFVELGCEDLAARVCDWR